MTLLAFLACASLQLVGHASAAAFEPEGSGHGAPAASEHGQDAWLAGLPSSSAQCRSQDDATPVRELSAVEAVDSEEIADLDGVKVDVASQLAPIARRIAERPALGCGPWSQPSLASSALPRGPP